MEAIETFPLVEDDGIVDEPPTLADACDPIGIPFDVTALVPPSTRTKGPRAITPAERIIAVALVAPLLGVLGFGLAHSAYAFLWLEDDRFVLADVTMDDRSPVIDRASFVIEDGEYSYEVSPKPELAAILAHHGVTKDGGFEEVGRGPRLRLLQLGR